MISLPLQEYGLQVDTIDTEPKKGVFSIYFVVMVLIIVLLVLTFGLYRIVNNCCHQLLIVNNCQQMLSSIFDCQQFQELELEKLSGWTRS